MDAEPIDQEAYKRLSGSMAKGVAVITARVGRWDHATPITDYLSVSYDPPTVLVSIYGLSRMAEALDASQTWALSILSAQQRGLADALAAEGKPLVGLLDQVPHRRNTQGGPAIIAGSLAWFELRTIGRYEAATHLLYVGEVLSMGRDAPTTARPLVRFQSGY